MFLDDEAKRCRRHDVVVAGRLGRLLEIALLSVFAELRDRHGGSIKVAGITIPTAARSRQSSVSMNPFSG
jgi:hypothetical protein